jgi:dipeptidyl aminopeptidase/acylaminoacyl peptidase
LIRAVRSAGYAMDVENKLQERRRRRLIPRDCRAEVVRGGLTMRLMLLCGVIAGVALSAPAAAQTPPPVEAFGNLPAVADAAISPDGRRLALATTQENGQSAIMVVSLDQTTQRTGFGVGDGAQLRAVAWADNERVAYLLNQTFQPGQVLPMGMYFQGRPRRIDYFRWGTINTTTGHARSLSTNEEDPWADMYSELVSPIEGDPGFGRMIGRSERSERGNAALFRINLDSGHVRTQAVNGIMSDTVGLIIDRTGAVAGRLDANRETNRWRLFTYDGDTPRLLKEDVSRFGEPMSVIGLTPDGRFAALNPSEAGFMTLYAIDRTTGEMQVMQEAPNADIDHALADPWTREVVGAAWTEDEWQERYLDPVLQAAHDALSHVRLFNAFRLVTWSQDRSRIIVFAERGMDGGGYYLFEPATSSLHLLAPRYPGLAQANLGERESITYRARDGTRIPAYLTLPAGADRQNLPLVVLVHGGPHGVRDTMSFDWWSSFLASRGYAVLQPNYRGSGGYGDAWEEAGRGQWGGLMQTDVEDGVVALARSGMADASRVCIVGASYGGYAALAGVTMTPDRYRCGVAVAGVSDLGVMLAQNEDETGDDSISSEWWRASIGDRREDRDRIRASSPALHADQVRAPVLLIHGTDDTVVPIEQSRRMQRALQNAGKEVRFVELRGDDHWLSDAPTRIQMLREIETFLAQNLRPEVNVDDSAAPTQTPSH